VYEAARLQNEVDLNVELEEERAKNVLLEEDHQDTLRQLAKSERDLTLANKQMLRYDNQIVALKKELQEKQGFSELQKRHIDTLIVMLGEKTLEIAHLKQTVEDLKRTIEAIKDSQSQRKVKTSSTQTSSGPPLKKKCMISLIVIAFVALVALVGYHVSSPRPAEGLSVDKDVVYAGGNVVGDSPHVTVDTSNDAVPGVSRVSFGPTVLSDEQNVYGPGDMVEILVTFTQEIALFPDADVMRSEPIAWNASALEVKNIIESIFDISGEVCVSRDQSPNVIGGFRWVIQLESIDDNVFGLVVDGSGMNFSEASGGSIQMQHITTDGILAPWTPNDGDLHTCATRYGWGGHSFIMGGDVRVCDCDPPLFRSSSYPHTLFLCS
jgi:hypothetical protein